MKDIAEEHERNEPDLDTPATNEPLLSEMITWKSNTSYSGAVVKTNFLGIIGGLLVVVGLFFPWFSFSKYSLDQVTVVHFSPFLLSIDVSGNKTLYWFQLNVGATIVGLVCLMGVILGLLGGSTNRGRISGSGGVVSLIATVLFPACIPGYYHNLSLNWGGIISAVGAFCMMASSIVTVGLLNKKSLDLRKQSSFLKKIPWKKTVGLQLELIAILGSIYCAYELSRLIFIILSSGSATLMIGNYPSWLYRLEMLLCLYTILYWCVRLIRTGLTFLLFSEE